MTLGERCRAWLIANDPEGEDVYRAATSDDDLIAAVADNIRDFGPASKGYIMINLDAMSREDLADAADTFRELARYASDKRIAMRMRLDGYVADAVKLEARLERIYDRLPAWARW